jgi:O-antigen chain-terminating methyltransferase
MSSSPEQSPTLNLDALMEKLREEVNARKRHASAPPTSTPPNSAPAAQGYRIDRLLALPDAEFVRAAYNAIFARDATEAEFTRSRDRLLTGETGRTRLLREFLRSGEALKRGARIEGLKRREFADWMRRSTPAKWAMNAAHTVRTIYLLPRRIRQFLKRVDGIERTAGETALRASLLSTRVEAAERTAHEVGRLLPRVDALETATASLERKLGESSVTVEQRFEGALRKIEAALQEISELRATSARHWREIANQKIAMQGLLEEARSEPSNSMRPSLAAHVANERDHQLDAFYVGFEDRYRGTREEIKVRQTVYLDRIKASVRQTGFAEVVDIGCGRGEWLELLGEAGIKAYGFDLNRIALEENKARGVDAREGDALKAIAAMDDESLAAVTAFHVAEHLPFVTLANLVEHSLRVLRPGGMLLLETPNPANLLVAAERFYLDPTHRNPLPSELMSYLIESRGFEKIEIVSLHPVAWPLAKAYDDPMLSLLQEKLFGPQDYGVIGWKPR